MNMKAKIALMGFMVLGISFLHYGIGPSQHHYHIFYRELFFIPIILAGSWFGLRGALLTTLIITAIFLPYTVITWKAFSPDDFNKVMDLFLYNIVGVILGKMKDRERAEHKRLLAAESLASMGRAITGVVHDIKTPLIAIGGYAQLVQKKLNKEDPSYDNLSVVIKETQWLENMVKEMLDFSKPLDLHRSQGDLNKMIKESIAIVEEATRGRNVKIKTQLDRDFLHVSFDASRMKQALVNLLSNAIQASPEREAVTVRTCYENGYFRIVVADNGCGITVDQRDKIFAPFFTTKNGEGTGLGLPIVKKIVEAHEGSVEVLNGAENGATFKVSLPIKSKRSTPV